MVEERGPEAAPGMGRRHADLLDVGAAVDDRADQVGDGAVVGVDRHPRAPGGPERLELGAGARIVERDLGHPDRREERPGLALDLDQRGARRGAAPGSARSRRGVVQRAPQQQAGRASGAGATARRARSAPPARAGPSSPYARSTARRMPRSPTASTSGRPSVNIRNMCALHSPMPLTATSSAITSSSESSLQAVELELAGEHVLGQRAQEGRPSRARARPRRAARRGRRRGSPRASAAGRRSARAAARRSRAPRAPRAAGRRSRARARA